MRDIRFKSKHRGGLLNKNEHILLSKWASLCAQHVLNLAGDSVNKKLSKLLEISEKWREGKVSVFESRKVALEAFNIAKKTSDPIEKMVARSVGHAIATAHAADHSLGASLYALKAVKLSKGSFEDEIKWQKENLPFEIKELIISSWNSERFKRLIKN